MLPENFQLLPCIPLNSIKRRSRAHEQGSGSASMVLVGSVYILMVAVLLALKTIVLKHSRSTYRRCVWGLHSLWALEGRLSRKYEDPRLAGHIPASWRRYRGFWGCYHLNHARLARTSPILEREGNRGCRSSPPSEPSSTNQALQVRSCMGGYA
jgi:hypothetical protein